MTFLASRVYIAFEHLNSIVFFPAQNIELKKYRFTMEEAKAISRVFKKNIDVEVIREKKIDLSSEPIIPLESQKLPLILFCAPSLPSAHQSIFAHFAKKGYIVMSLYHESASIISAQDSCEIINTKRTYEEREQYIVEDFLALLAILRQGKHKISSYIDFDLMHIMGFSLGGSAALKIASHYPNFLSCTNIDGSIFGSQVENLKSLPPLLFIDSDFSLLDLNELETHLNSRKHIFDSNEIISVGQKIIAKAKHTSFSDLTYIDSDDKHLVIEQTNNVLLSFLRDCEIKKK